MTRGAVVAAFLVLAAAAHATWENVYATWAPTIVRVDVIKYVKGKPKHTGHGSGVIVSKSGQIATAYHVVDAGDQFIVHTFDGRAYGVYVSTVDTKNDLAILVPTLARKEPLWARLRESTVVGEPVCSIGYPLVFHCVLGIGVVSGYYKDTVVTTVNMSPGSSGGPAFDAAGRVVGLTTAMFCFDSEAMVPTGYGMLQRSRNIKLLLNKGHNAWKIW